jgi:hypothetical protein
MNHVKEALRVFMIVTSFRTSKAVRCRSPLPNSEIFMYLTMLLHLDGVVKRYFPIFYSNFKTLIGIPTSSSVLIHFVATGIEHKLNLENDSSYI